jgi:hypothetical protein
MWGLLLRYEWPRALVAGVVYMVLYASGSLLVWAVQRWLQGQHSAQAIRIRRWPGWPFVVQVLNLLLAIAFPFFMLLTGIFAVSDVGLQPVGWPGVLPWSIGITAGAAVWLAVLWRIYSRTSPPSGATTALEPLRAEAPQHGNLAAVLLSALRHEAAVATCRGAIIPLAGPYWGSWLAVLWKMLIARTNPFLNSRLRRSGERERVFLDWALDWVGTTLFVFSGSAWVALGGRIICRCAVLLALRRQPPSAPANSVDEQGENRQDDKGATGQNAEVLQIA